jgi:hypothetical protein
MIAWIYSFLPKLDAKANAPFWMSPVATEVEKTIIKVNAKYPDAGIPRKAEVDMQRRVNTIVFRMRAYIIRLG